MNDILHTGSGHYITVEDKTRLYVEDVGEGKPVVFVHGLPVNHRMYEYQQTALTQEGVRFIGIDLRGYGRSDHPLHGYDYNRMADDIRSVVDKLELKDFVLAGFSMGGGIVTRYMARHEGHGVERLMMFGAAVPQGLPLQAAEGMIAGFSADRPQMLTGLFQNFFHTPPSSEVEKWMWNLGIEANAQATLEGFRALGSEELHTDLNRIHVPTLILHGVHDRVIPFAAAEEAHRAIPGSKLVRFENSGHGLFYEEKEKFNQEILGFVHA